MKTLALKKSLVALFCCGLAVVAYLTLIDLTTTTAIADPAIVVRDDGICGMPGADADGNLIIGGFGTVNIRLENDNKVSLSCKGKGLTNLSGRGQFFSGFGCGIIVPSGGFVVTTDSHATVAASGNGSLTCTFTKP